MFIEVKEARKDGRVLRIFPHHTLPGFKIGDMVKFFQGWQFLRSKEDFNVNTYLPAWWSKLPEDVRLRLVGNYSDSLETNEHRYTNLSIAVRADNFDPTWERSQSKLTY